MNDMNKDDWPEKNEAAFDAFTELKKHLADQGTSIGDHIEDWWEWWAMFLAGWKAREESRE